MQITSHSRDRFLSNIVGNVKLIVLAALTLCLMGNLTKVQAQSIDSSIFGSLSDRQSERFFNAGKAKFDREIQNLLLNKYEFSERLLDVDPDIFQNLLSEDLRLSEDEFHQLITPKIDEQ